MSTQIIVLALLVAGIVAFFIGVARARSAARANPDVKLHSRFGYYGAYALICTALPGIILALLWSAISPGVVSRQIQSELPAQVQALSGPEQALIMGQVNSVADGIKRLSPEDSDTLRKARYGFATIDDAAKTLQENGVILGASPEKYVIAAGYDRVVYDNYSRWTVTGIAAVLAVLGFLFAMSRIQPRMKARNAVEGVILGGF